MRACIVDICCGYGKPGAVRLTIHSVAGGSLAAAAVEVAIFVVAKDAVLIEPAGEEGERNGIGRGTVRAIGSCYGTSIGGACCSSVPCCACVAVAGRFGVATASAVIRWFGVTAAAAATTSAGAATATATAAARPATPAAAAAAAAACRKRFADYKGARRVNGRGMRVEVSRYDCRDEHRS